MPILPLHPSNICQLMNSNFCARWINFHSFHWAVYDCYCLIRVQRTCSRPTCSWEFFFYWMHLFRADFQNFSIEKSGCLRCTWEHRTDVVTSLQNFIQVLKGSGTTQSMKVGQKKLSHRNYDSINQLLFRRRERKNISTVCNILKLYNSVEPFILKFCSKLQSFFINLVHCLGNRSL